MAIEYKVRKAIRAQSHYTTIITLAEVLMKDSRLLVAAPLDGRAREIMQNEVHISVA